ncbi:MAG: hypothetical protein WEF99_08820, partial [Thermoanaerobaculia bacterium]
MARTDTEQLVVQLEARVRDFERNMVKANKTANDNLTAIERKSRQSGRSLEQNMRRSTERVTGSFSTMAGRISRILGPLGIGLSFAAVVRGIQNTISAAAELGDFADRIEVSAEALQRLRFAAEQSGSSAQQLDDALQRLTRRVGLFRQEGGGPAAAALERLGLAARITSGELDNTEDIFRAVVGELENIEGAADKAAIASQLFGEDAGPKLVLLLSRGAEGMREIEAQANVLTNKMVANAQRINDEWSALVDTIGTDLKRAVLDAIDALGIMGTDRIDTVKDKIEEVTEELREAEAQAERVRIGLGEGEVLDQELAKVEEVRSRLAALRREFSDLRRDLIEGVPLSRRPRPGDDDTSPAGPPTPEERPDAPSRPTPRDTGFDASRIMQDLQRDIEAQEEAQRRMREEALRTLDVIDDRFLRSTDQQIRLIVKRRDADLAALESMALTEAETARARVQIIETANVEIAEIERRRSEEAREGLAEAEAAAQQFASTITSALGQAVSSGGDLRSVLAGLANDLAQIIIRLTVMKQIESSLGSILGGSSGGLFSGLFGGASAASAGALPAPINPAIMHEGGIAGRGGPTRRVNPAVFANAPHFQSGGIAGDEVPAVLHRGEGVFTPDQMQALGGRKQFEGATFNIDARGADAGQIRRLEEQIFAIGATV